MRTVSDGETLSPLDEYKRSERRRQLRQEKYIELLEAFVRENKAPGAGEQQLTSFMFQAEDAADAEVEKESK